MTGYGQAEWRAGRPGDWAEWVERRALEGNTIAQAVQAIWTMLDDNTVPEPITRRARQLVESIEELLSEPMEND